MEDATVFIDQSEPAWQARSGAGFAVVSEVTGELLGACGLVQIDGDTGEVGYWTERAARGHGVATVACGLLSGWALGELGLKRLDLFASPDNRASQLVAERNDFTRAGTANVEIRPGDSRLHLHYIRMREGGRPETGD